MSTVESASGRRASKELAPNSPINVDTPTKLGRYLELQEYISDGFKREIDREGNLVDRLNDNDEQLIYRGIPPQKVFNLIQEQVIKLEPFQYETGEGRDSNVQNASYLYSNAIMHGTDPEGQYNFVAAVGFSTEGLTVKSTGRRMAEVFATRDEKDQLPGDKEFDVTVEGVLEPDMVQVITFRFLVDGKPKTLVYRRQKGIANVKNAA